MEQYASILRSDGWVEVARVLSASEQLLAALPRSKCVQYSFARRPADAARAGYPFRLAICGTPHYIFIVKPDRIELTRK
ncbi:MAG: hypothetical protein IKG21_05745 [Atopobiaceae bacterium]|nr:hypothetical protein [Atopobiaceae bacterium]